ncbi:2-hydroxychromene-2-carboxylate isomerase [Polaromonas sp.]|uniref:2-hydroxychromene-2-carboxylate isomerase n=1 Tax=Polaromonas sp. TaxID=1869339 RepID=UPI0038621A2F
MQSFEFWFDYGSPAAYLAWTQLPRLEAETGATAVYQPMLLGGVFQATGNQSPMAIAAKGAYAFTDLARFARRYGVPLGNNPHFPINTLMLMRGAVALQMRDEARLPAYSKAVFEAIWVDAANLNDPATVGKTLAAAGFDPMALLALAGEQAVKDRLKELTRQAVARGVFGAPTFFVGDQMFWGQDRIDFVKEALQ